MLRRLAPFLLAIPLLIQGCSGPSKLTQKSEEKLAGGDAWRAWQLATRALDKEPGNPRSRAAATAAGAAIAQDWQRRIHALAETDSLKAAAQVLELTEFRESASRYATIPVGPEWPAEERILRQMAARTHFQRGREAADSGRPKKAYAEFTEAELYVTDYRDVAKRADKALGQALTNVAVVPFRARSDEPSLGVQVAQAWRDNLVQGLAPPAARFTRILGGDTIERTMTLSQLEDVTREEAIRLGREMRADRVVWGSIGAVKSSTRLNLFKDTVCRRVTARDADGHESSRWVDVPIEVVARVRDVTVGVDYEVIATRSSTTIARRHVDRSTSARSYRRPLARRTRIAPGMWRRAGSRCAGTPRRWSRFLRPGARRAPPVITSARRSRASWPARRSCSSRICPLPRTSPSRRFPEAPSRSGTTCCVSMKSTTSISTPTSRTPPCVRAIARRGRKCRRQQARRMWGPQRRRAAGAFAFSLDA